MTKAPIPLKTGLLLGIFLIGTLSPPRSRADEIIRANESWRYFKGTREASSPDPTAWRNPGFNDASWETGRAPFYYENGNGFTGNTLLGDMFGGYTTVFLRHSFPVASPSAYSDLTLNVFSDDGCIVWLNGKELTRINVPSGNLPYNANSLPAAGEPNQLEWIVENPSEYLIAGSNVLAIQAINSSIANSSDFFIEAGLSGTKDTLPPQVLSIVPPPMATIRELTFIDVTFDDSVQGVDAKDLLINGKPALELEVISPRQYVFTAPALDQDSVAVSWDPNHGIRDFAGEPNDFEGGAWTYTVDATAPESLVIISEFLADNEKGIRDEDGDRSDWIEIFNVGPAEVNLNQWTLSDDPGNPGAWPFPSTVLEAGQFLVVWASGKNRAVSNSPLHTNFRLARDGDYLGLHNPTGKAVSEFKPSYPPQQPDVSYGRDAGDIGLTGYFLQPTPGEPNASSGPGFAPSVRFSTPGGVYSAEGLTLTLSSASGIIRYTLNGEVPTSSSSVYNAPIRINETTTVRARAFEGDLLPGPVETANYLVAGAGIADFNSNLPVMVIETGRRGIPQDSRIPARVTTLEPIRGKTTLFQRPSFQGLAQIEIRGQTSSGFPKKPYNLEINDEFGADIEVPLLGLPEESDWVLNNPYSDKSFMNNFLAYELHEAMGHYAVQRRYVEVFVDTNGGSLNYPQDYMGLYVLLEKIKIDNNRVDLERMLPTSNTEPEITGGYIIKKDKNSPGDRNFSTNGGAGFSRQNLKYHDPKPWEITPAQQSWIRNYLNEFESALYASDWLSRPPGRRYSDYVDLVSFADNFWIVEFAKQIDGYRLSNYMSKDRGGKLKMEPIWDWNLSFGNANYNTGDSTSGWYYTVIGEGDHIWMRRMMHGTSSAFGNSGDPDFLQVIADRWGVFRETVLNGPRVIARIDEIAAVIGEAAARDFSRWPRLGSYVWPNPVYYVSPRSHAGVVNVMKTWVTGRYNWIDSQFLKAPIPGHPGGGVTPGFKFQIQSSQGTVYYTLNGTDPRASGGSVSPRAIRYTDQVEIKGNSKLMARSRQGSQWSPPVEAVFTVRLPELRISEIMFDPVPDTSNTGKDPNDFEFLELMNLDSEPIDLNGIQFSKGIQFQFNSPSPLVLQPEERILLVRNQEAFLSRYPDTNTKIFVYQGLLDNQGETLEIVDPYGIPLFEVDYDRWAANDRHVRGFSLVATSDSGWVSGAVPGGTPGLPESMPSNIPPVWVNEALAHTDPPLKDAVELHNPNPFPVDISGWYLSDDPTDPKVRLAPGTLIAANGYRVFEADAFEPTPDRPQGFNLRSAGDEIFLFSANPQGELTGYKHGFRFGPTLNGVSVGRYPVNDGKAVFIAQSKRTLGQPNSGPQVGPVVVSEIMYHPEDIAENGALWDNTRDEFIELTNISDREVALFDPEFPENTWEIKGGIQFVFQPGTRLPPGERMVLVAFDPDSDPDLKTSFINRYSMGVNTRILGPFSGKLDNGGERIRLVQKDSVQFYGLGTEITEVLVDEVDYNDAAPWPIGADGLGFSLQKTDLTSYGNRPGAWTARAPTPGSPTGTEPLPTVSHPPTSPVIVEIGSDAKWSVDASGDPPLRFAWKRNGTFLPFANSKDLSLPDVQTEFSGDYTAVAWNHIGAAQSNPIELKVVSYPEIDFRSADLDLMEGSSAQLEIRASSDSPMRYQWMHNNRPVPGATRNTLSLASVSERNQGDYALEIRNASGRYLTDPIHVSIQVSDHDQDGLPDSFETSNGLNPDDASDALLDPDGDGVSNYREYVAGSDLRDGSSFFGILPMESGNPQQIRFMGSSARTYRVLGKESLTDHQWMELAILPMDPSSEPAWAIRTWDMPPTQWVDPTTRYIQIQALILAP